MPELLSKAGKPDAEGCIQRITPKGAGWDHVGFEAYLLKPGMRLSRDTGATEVCLVLVAGVASVETRDGKFHAIGKRMSPFERTAPYSVYVPPDNAYALTAETEVELAVCSAPAKGRLPSRLIGPNDVGPLVHRGKGRNQRDVHNILADDSQAESLLVVEVFTGEGNTSSYPSHKHDRADGDKETYLEETYYHRFDPPQGWAMQRVYTDDRTLDECVAPYNHDVVMVPKGYHPVAAIAGYDNYYLNVMAGPVKLWRFTWEKDHAWINGDGYPRQR